MSSELASRPSDPQTDRSNLPGEQQPTGMFLRSFLVLQAVFILFFLIAAIPEAPSEYSRASAANQLVAVASFWALSDVAALVVRAIRVRAHRPSR